MATGPEVHQQNKLAKWVIIIAAIIAAILVFGLFTDWFGLYGVEQAPGVTSNLPAS